MIVKKRMAKGLIVGCLSMAMMLSVASPIFAAGQYSEDISGTATMTFDKYLVMDQYANVPNATFNFAVTAGAAIPATSGVMEVKAGITPEAVTVSDSGVATFSPSDSAVNTANTNVKNYTPGDQKYATKSLTLDFSAVQFTEPGIYRYIITETGTNRGVTNDTNDKRYVDVYVVDNTTSDTYELKIENIVMHANADTISANATNGSDGTEPEGKSQGFTNVYDTSDLTFYKEVTGNQGSRDKYFKFTVTINNAVAGTKYTVDISGADASVQSNDATTVSGSNVTEITATSSGTVTQDFYLRHGQKITIRGLVADTQYTVTEDAEDYKSEGAVVTEYTDPTTGTIATADINTSYRNTRDGVIPTGILMTVAPFAALMFIGMAGMLIFMRRRRTNE